MKLLRQSLLLLPLAVLGLHAAPETRRQISAGPWEVESQASRHLILDFHIALAAEDPSLIEQHAREVSDPQSPRWRQFLSPSETAKIMSPSNETVDAVVSWLESAGITSNRVHDSIKARISVTQAEELLNASYSIYKHSSGKRTIRTDQYSIPENLRAHIDFISPTTNFPMTRRADGAKTNETKQAIEAEQGPQGQVFSHGQLSGRADGSSLIGPCGNGSYPNSIVTPECIRAAYSVDWNASNANTTWGIFNVDNGNYNESALLQYLRRYRPEAALDNATFYELNQTGYLWGGPNDSEEIDLDTQLSTGVAWPARGILVQGLPLGIYGNYTGAGSARGQQVGRDDFLDFLHGMTYNDTVPPIVSFSAGGNEGALPYDWAQRVCKLFAASGARGVTWIVASGDDGPVGAIEEDHTLTLDAGWPQSCPWVLAVGATANPFNETAATAFTTGNLTSGGGFSNLFPRPWYQDSTVPFYIEDHVDPSFKQLPGFNASGRGFPDVSALGFDVPIITLGGRQLAEGGTSAAAPMWAAFIALLNDYEAGRGKPTLGFINPWLYSLGDGGGGELRDITVGSGVGFGKSQAVKHARGPYPDVGFNATVGWDALTGLGVAVFDKMRMALP